MHQKLIKSNFGGQDEDDQGSEHNLRNTAMKFKPEENGVSFNYEEEESDDTSVHGGAIESANTSNASVDIN